MSAEENMLLCSTLANLYQQNNNFTAALQLRKQHVTQTKMKRGENNVYYINSVIKLADVLAASGDLAEAVEQQTKVVELAGLMFGGEHQLYKKQLGVLRKYEKRLLKTEL